MNEFLPEAFLSAIGAGLTVTVKKNRDVIVKELGAFSGLKVIPPDGTFYILPDFRYYNQKSVELARAEGESPKRVGGLLDTLGHCPPVTIVGCQRGSATEGDVLSAEVAADGVTINAIATALRNSG